MDLRKYGFTPEMMKETENILNESVVIPARVTAVHRERYQLVCEHGEIYARLKTKEYYVELEEFPTTGDFVLINYIPNGDSQIVKTLPRKTFFSRLDPTPGRGEQAVAANFEYVFIMLKNGAMIIDTPGMRGLGMWDVSIGLYGAFGDVEQYLGKCKFADCKHLTEPGCAIKRAIAEGDLSQERFESYCKLKNEARYSDDKTAYMRDKVKWHKEVAKNNRRMKAEKKKYRG